MTNLKAVFTKSDYSSRNMFWGISNTSTLNIHVCTKTMEKEIAAVNTQGAKRKQTEQSIKAHLAGPESVTDQTHLFHKLEKSPYTKVLGYPDNHCLNKN